jgi:hypothetical protein
MTSLIEQFNNVREEYNAFAQKPWENADIQSLQELNSLREEKEKALLKQMSNEDIQIIIDNTQGNVLKAHYAKFLK